MFIWFTWPRKFFWGVAQHLAKHSKFFAGLVAFITWLSDFIDKAIVAVLGTLVQMIENINVDEFNNVSLSTVEYIGYANAILPISEWVVLMGIYLTAWMTVVIIRWIKSFVPTVAN